MPIRFRRYGQIADVMLKYGFGILIDELAPLGIRWGQRRRTEVYGSVYVRIRLALQELGPTYIKFGQVMSTRRDLLPPPLIEELKHLQDDVAPVPFDQVLPYILEQCPTLSSCIASIDPVPLAAASLSQVHAAVLADGREVVLKVQRPGIVEAIGDDIAILKQLAIRAEQLFPDLETYNPQGMIREFEEHIWRELDFVRDGRNADRLRENMHEVPRVRVPKVHWSLSGPRLLVMERIDGVRVDDREAVRSLGFLGREIAETGLQAYVKQIFVDGFFHGDPHAGNLLVTPQGELAFLDFGIMGVLRAEKRRAFIALLMGFVERDVDAIVHALRAIGIRVADDRVEPLKDEIYLLVTEYRDLSIRQYDMSRLISDGTDLLRRNGLRLPSSLMRMLVVLMMVINIGQALDPDFQFTERAEPYLREVIGRDRLSFKRVEAGIREFEEAASELVGLPATLSTAARRFTERPIELDLVNPDVHRIEKILDQAGDKVLIGLVTAAIVVGSSLVLEKIQVSLPGWLIFIAGISYIGAVVIGFFAIYHVLRGRL